MKTKLTLLSLLIIAVVIYSCKKSSNSVNQNQAATTKIEYGLGAKLNPQLYQSVPKADFVKIKAMLVKMGYGDKVLNSTTPPSSMILTHPTPGNQGSDGTCVSWSVGYALRGVLNYSFPNGIASNPRSPQFIYQMDHSQSHDCSTTDGMYVASGMQLLQFHGVPSNSLDASLGSPCTVPGASVLTDALKDTVISYSSVSTIADIKSAISMGLPVEMGFMDYTNFDNAFTYGTIWTTIGGTYRGNHAVCIIGYDDSKNAVLVQNSWGLSGGDPSNPGCVWIDYGLVTSTSLGIELYVATPPPVININGSTNVTWNKLTSASYYRAGSGTISAPPGTLVHVDVDAYGPAITTSGQFRVTNFQISGATLSSPMGSAMYVSSGVMTGTFTMPSSGSVTWTGYFDDNSSTTGGFGSIGVY